MWREASWLTIVFLVDFLVSACACRSVVWFDSLFVSLSLGSCFTRLSGVKCSTSCRRGFIRLYDPCLVYVALQHKFLIGQQFLLAFVMFRAVYPWKDRRDLWSTVLNVVTAPFGRCIFRDTFAGDVMTSLVKVFSDVAYTACFIGTGEVMKLAPGRHSTISADVCKHAPGYALVASPAVHAAPLVCRYKRWLPRHQVPHSCFCSGFVFFRTFAGVCV